MSPDPPPALPPALLLCEPEVLRALPMWEVGAFRGLPGERGGTANPAVVVDTEGGRFFLKRRNPRYSAPEMLRHDHALMEHLASKGFPAPLALTTRERRRWAEIEGRVYELYPYLPGEAHDPSRLEQIAEAGRALAAFHRAAADFVPPPGKEWPRYHDPAQSIAGLRWAVLQLRERRGPTPAGRERGPALEEVRGLLEMAHDLADHFTDDEYWGYPALLVHGDWHPANVKYKGDSISGVFDLDWASRQPRLVDLADGVAYFAGLRPGRLDAGDIRTLTRAFTLHPERVGPFLAAYHRAEVLSDRELQALPRFLLARWLWSRIDPMRRKIPPEEATDYLLDGVWGPVEVIRRFDFSHELFT